MTATATNEVQAQEVAIVADLASMIESIQVIDVADKQQLTTKNVAEKLNEIIAIVKQMQAGTVQGGASRDRGPKSDRDMNETDARAIMLGELKDVSHKVAAEKLGLSYGQVYSARKGFTFKAIYKEAEMAKKAAA